MDADCLRRVKELFFLAADLPPDQRQRCLDEHRGGDDGVRARVAQLLEHVETDPDGDLVAPGVIDLDAAVDGSVEQRGRTFGDFVLLEELGRGGMGVVWLAEQKRLQRKVALKLVRPAARSEALLSRFHREAASLIRLEHPGIAQVYEVGTATIGIAGITVEQPYFAMEYVPGQPLDEYARSHELPLRARLELVARICDAVEHAHRQGVVHRDLKPDNILVTAAGAPKVLDIGIARVTGSDVVTMTRQTAVGRAIGSVPYMSPEQVLGDVRGIDARSDVYSLGAVLYQLLSGRLPVDVHGRSISDAARIIRDAEPTRLGAITAGCRGDIETIVQNAIEKDRGRRYQSAAELGADIRRFLAHQPIVARPATTMNVVRKFVRRHKGRIVGLTARLGARLRGAVVSLLTAARERCRRRPRRY